MAQINERAIDGGKSPAPNGEIAAGDRSPGFDPRHHTGETLTRAGRGVTETCRGLGEGGGGQALRKTKGGGF